MKNKFDNVFGEEFDLCTLGIPHYNYFQKRVAEIISKKGKKLKNPITILDIGAGTGNIIKELLQKRILFTYTGIESTPTMYEQLTARYNHLSNVQIHLIDALKFLESEISSKYMVVINSWTFHNWDKKYRRKVLKLIHNYIGDEGILINADKIASDSPHEHQRNYKWQIEYIRKIFSSRNDIIEEWITHYAYDEADNIVLRENEYKNELKKIGFSEYVFIERKFMDIISIAIK